MWLVTGLSLACSEGQAPPTEVMNDNPVWPCLVSLTSHSDTKLNGNGNTAHGWPFNLLLVFEIYNMIWVWHHACFIWHIHDICVNLCHLLFLCNYIWFWLVQQYLKTAPGSADRHIITLLQPVVESGLGTCAPSIDPTHIVTLLCWARQCNSGEERSKCLTACKCWALHLTE